MSFEEVATLINKLHERKPAGVSLTPDMCYNIVAKKIDASTLQQLGGEEAVKMRIGALLKQLSGKVSSSSSSDDDDDDDSSDSDSSSGSSGSDDDSKPAAAGGDAAAAAAGSDDDDDDDDSSSDDEDEEEGDEDDDDDIFADSDDESDAAEGAGQRRQRNDDDDDPLADISKKPAEERCVLMTTFGKKIGVECRARGAEETVEDHLAHLVEAFKKADVDPNDVSRGALKYQKQMKEVRDLQKECDLTLDPSQRRGKPIYDSNGKFIGVHGGSSATASKSSLCDD